MNSSLPDFSQAKRLSKALKSQGKLSVPIWPNALGRAPTDAIGKIITMKEFGLARVFEVKATDDNNLILEEVSA